MAKSSNGNATRGAKAGSTALARTAPVRQPARTAQHGLERRGDTDVVEQPEVLGTRRYSDKPQFDSDDVMVPRLKVAQGLSPEVVGGEAEIGEILLAGSDNVESCVLVPMVYSKCRELRDDQGQGPILCQSGDSKTGVGDPGGSCARCEFAQWRDNTSKKGGTNKPPLCTQIYSYGFWSDTHQSQVIMDFKKTQIPAAKGLNSLCMKFKGFGTWAVELSTSIAKNAKGQAFAVPSFKVVKVKPDVLEAAQRNFTFGRSEPMEDLGDQE